MDLKKAAKEGLVGLEQALFESDLGRLIRERVLPGHRPSAPRLNHTDSVITLGSCFARELCLFLSLAGVDSTRFWIPSGLNNTFGLLAARHVWWGRSA